MLEKIGDKKKITPLECKSDKKMSVPWKTLHLQGTEVYPGLTCKPREG